MVKQQNSHRLIVVFLDTFGGPLLWGLIFTFCFYFAIRQGLIDHPLLVRYTAGHPVEYVEVGLFAVGLAAIVRRGRLTAWQLLAARSLSFQQSSEADLARRVASLGQQIDGLSRRLRESLYVRRLSAALDFLRRHDSADQLDDELKYLSELDAEHSHEGYALVRIVIWATPMLGFLGTVIGITLALGDLSPEALVNSPKEAMEGLLSGLSVAFDTTALALTLSMVLMFSQFLTQQLEAQLLALIDRRIPEDLAGCFSRRDLAADPQVATLQSMAKAMIGAMESNTQRQTEIWQQALVGAQQQWAQAIRQTGQSVHESVAQAVAGAVRESLQQHTGNLARLEEAARQAAGSNWRQWHEASAETLRQLRSQQTELSRHGEILAQALQATGEVIKLEQALNQNLRALAGAKNFEDTVMSLSAAIHLLSSRLGRPLPRDAQVKLEVAPQERAA